MFCLTLNAQIGAMLEIDGFLCEKYRVQKHCWVYIDLRLMGFTLCFYILHIRNAMN